MELEHNVTAPIIEGQNYINGVFSRGSGDTFDDIDPATGEVLGTFNESTDKEIDSAYQFARDSFYGWRTYSRVQRAEYFLKLAQIIEQRRDEIARVISLETGKVYNESIAEVNEALHMAQYAFSTGRMPYGEAIASELPEKDAFMLRKPKGVVAVIAPFNFPFAIGGFWCSGPALVEGNTVILKPSEDVPWIGQLTAELYHEAGFPPGVFNVVQGDGKVGDQLIHKDVDHVCFTGSADVGMHVRKVCAESWHKTCSCEMGSKSAVIIHEDANYDMAMAACLASAYKLSGQRCVSAGRLIVHRSLYNRFADEFANRSGDLKTGDPFDDNTFYGPLVNKQGLDKVEKFNSMVFNDSKADVLLAGTKPVSGGLFMTPTVYQTEWRDAPYLKNEVFGPHVSIIPYDSVSEAIHIYNDTDYGLSLGVVTENFKVARRIRNECDFGLGYWNGGSIAAESHLGFGGVKKSGNGQPSAARTFRSVTHEVAWTVNHGDSLNFPQGMNTGTE
jgi:aldehyde dehydrogenase (NAD+)